MKLRDYFKDKFYYLISAAGAMIIIFIFLFVFNVPITAIVYILLLLILVFGFWFFGEYRKRSVYYKDLIAALDSLDKKYLISEITEPASFADSEIYYSILKEASKSMNDEIAKHKRASKDYKDYIENWVHEIKTPISAMHLALENSSIEYSSQIAGDLDNIEKFVLNALYYARISVAEKDYLIKETTLSAIVKQALKYNSRSLIANHIAIELENLDISLFTDIKWITFILSQIISNAVKYRKSSNSKLIFTGESAEEKVILKISDNGIGIPQSDLPRIFEKGFTGINGRKFGASTGMGLYMCAKLCAKLGIEISACCSEFTEFILVFPKTDFYLK